MSLTLHFHYAFTSHSTYRDFEFLKYGNINKSLSPMYQKIENIRGKCFKSEECIVLLSVIFECGMQPSTATFQYFLSLYIYLIAAIHAPHYCVLLFALWPVFLLSCLAVCVYVRLWSYACLYCVKLSIC